MPTKCRTDESKSRRIHHMQWFKGAFRIPPIDINKERANTCHPFSCVYNNKFIQQIRKLTRYRRWRRTWRAHCASRMMMGPRVVVWAAVETLKKQQHR